LNRPARRRILTAGPIGPIVTGGTSRGGGPIMGDKAPKDKEKKKKAADKQKTTKAQPSQSKTDKK